jgi:hypothetical protein
VNKFYCLLNPIRIAYAILILNLLNISGIDLHAQDIEAIGKEKPVKVNGSLAVFSDHYMVQGIEPRSPPVVWRLTGNPNLHLFGMVFPFYFNICTHKRSFAKSFN